MLGFEFRVSSFLVMILLLEGRFTAYCGSGVAVFTFWFRFYPIVSLIVESRYDVAPTKAMSAAEEPSDPVTPAAASPPPNVP